MTRSIVVNKGHFESHYKFEDVYGKVLEDWFSWYVLGSPTKQTKNMPIPSDEDWFRFFCWPEHLQILIEWKTYKLTL